MAADAIKKHTFAWEGMDKSGRRVKGEMNGTSVSLINATLRRQGVNPLKVKKKAKPLFQKSAKKIVTKDIAIFSRQLATMMQSGVPLVQAIDIAGRGHANANMQDLLMSLKGDVEAGGTLTEALAKHPYHFNELYVNLIGAGEQSGNLENMLNEIADYQEKTEALKSKIKAALFYPTAVIVVAGIIVTILMIFVIPAFGDMFSNFGADLPALTQMVVNMSEFFVAKWYIMFGVLAATVVGFSQAKRRSKKFAHFLDRASLKIPIIGDILEKSAIARFSRTLSTMFAAGTPLVEAMDSVAGACGNILFYDATLKMRDEVATGIQLQQAMKDSELFPNMVIQMVMIGEESGSVDHMLAKVADWYEQEVDDAVSSLTSLLEPIIMAFLGVVIGGLVIAMYLPIFKMGQVV